MNAIVQFRPGAEVAAESTVLHALLQGCSACVALVEEGRVVYANRAFAEALGFFHREDVEGRAIGQLFPGTAGAFCGSGAGAGIVPGFLDAMQRDGSRRRMLATGTRLGANGRDLLAITLHARPLTREDEQRLQEAERLEALGRLVGGVAHDFNNLLTGILLYSDLLLAGLGRQEPLADYIREIRQAGEQSAGLIAQLLGFVRRQAPNPRAFSWQEVIEGMRNLLQRLIGENIEVATEFSDEAGGVGMDAAYMRQIVLNLVLNARDAMPQGGRITLVVRNGPAGDAEGPAEARRVELVVADSGCGMDAATRTRMFEPFFTTKTGGQGNGLGLATVRRIVEEHQGTVAAHSRAGRGTQVSVCLPRADCEELSTFQERQR